MGKTAMNIGDDWHDAETRALRQTLLDTQANLRSKEAELAKAQQALAECHHRIANNLQLVLSFLRMQASSTPLVALKNGLQSAAARVEAITRLHKQFQGQPSVSQLDFGAYVTALAEDLRAGLGIKCTVRAESILLEEHLSVDLAIAINELAVNAAKYGCGSDETSYIEISCCRDDRGNLCVVVRDHGPGLPVHHEKVGGISRGLSFVRAIVTRHNGELLIENDGGARVTMLIPRS